MYNKDNNFHSREGARNMTNMRLILAIFGIAVLFTSMASTAAYAVSYWHIGAKNTGFTNIKEIRSNINVPTSPSSNAVTQGTLYWIGGFTDAGYLTQPEIRAWNHSPDQWRVKFEVVDTAGNRPVSDWTNVYFTPGTSIQLDDSIGTNNANCQFATDINNSLNSVNRCYSNYGSYISEIYATLESTDFTGSDFNPMGSINYSSYNYYTTIGGSPTTPTLNSYRYTSDLSQSPPTCITSSGGNGVATITVAC